MVEGCGGLWRRRPRGADSLVRGFGVTFNDVKVTEWGLTVRACSDSTQASRTRSVRATRTESRVLPEPGVVFGRLGEPSPHGVLPDVFHLIFEALFRTEHVIE